MSLLLIERYSCLLPFSARQFLSSIYDNVWIRFSETWFALLAVISSHVASKPSNKIEIYSKCCFKWKDFEYNYWLNRWFSIFELMRFTSEKIVSRCLSLLERQQKHWLSNKLMSSNEIGKITIIFNPII